MKRFKNRINSRKEKRKLLFMGVLLSILLVAGCSEMQKEQAISSEKKAEQIAMIEKEKEKKAEEERQKKLAEEEAAKKKIVKDSNHIKAAEKYAYDTKEIREMMLGQKEPDGKKVAFLTFDDGPNHVVSPQVLDVLDKENVPATFFVVGRGATEKFRDVLERIIKDGHAIALHSFSHNYQKLYPGRTANPSAIMEEVNSSNEALQNILGEDFKSHVFRYPGGNMSWNGVAASDEALANAGIEWIDWNSLVGDGERKRSRPTTVSGQVEYVKWSLEKNENKEKAVILLHDAENKQLTADALPSVIQYLRDQGYTFGILK